MFVGEGPGQDEDLAGEPFVGAAGQLLTRIIEAIQLTARRRLHRQRRQVPAARQPHPAAGGDRHLLPVSAAADRRHPAAVHLHAGRLRGADAARHDGAHFRLRGRFYDYEGIRVLPTFHPAYLLRNPEKKREVWEDMKRLMKEYPYEG